MLIIILSYLGGLLTIASPCILPVLPFIFVRADQPFIRSGLPLLLGMALTFTLFATLAAVGGGWVVAVSQYGRIAALILMAVFGLTLMFPPFGEWLMHPLVNAGNSLSEKIADPDPEYAPVIIRNNRLHVGCIFWQPTDFSANSDGVIHPSAEWGRL